MNCIGIPNNPMRHSFPSALFAALLGLAGGRARADDLDRLMALLAERTNGHVRFEEEDRVALLSRPLRSNGELRYQRPDRLEKITLAPKPSSIIVEGDTLTMILGRHKRVFALKDYPQLAPFIESLRATLAGDRVALERTFKVDFEGNLDNWTLRLTPLDPSLIAVAQEVHIDGARDELRSLRISQPDGDSSVMNMEPAPAP
jgi:hypothetical protein